MTLRYKLKDLKIATAEDPKWLHSSRMDLRMSSSLILKLFVDADICRAVEMNCMVILNRHLHNNSKF